MKWEQVEHIQTKFIDAFELAETEKKKSMLTLLCRVYGKELRVPEAMMQQIADAEDYDSVRNLYRGMVRDYRVTEHQLLESVETSNLLEEMKMLDEHGGEIESALRIIAIMPDLEHLTPDRLDILERSGLLNPALAQLVKRVTKNSRNLFAFTKKDFSIRSIARLDSMNMHDDARAREYLEERFGIAADEYYERCQEYDRFISAMSKEPIKSLLSHEYNISFVEQLNDVVNCSPGKLLQIAAGVGPLVEKYREEGNFEELKRLIHEGRRKLLAVSILSPAMKRYGEKREQNNEPIEAVWDCFQSTPRTMQVERVTALDGALIDILTSHSPENMRNRYRAFKEQQKAAISDPQLDSMRELHLGDKAVKARVYERDIKDEISFIRKAMMGDADPTDLFARALVIDSYDDALLKREDRQVEIADNGNVKKETVNDHAIVFRIMDALKEQMGRRLGAGWICSFKKYSPTPEGEDYQYHGRRAGTGGRIRMSKFVTTFKSQDGSEYSEEVQIFTPDPEHRKSGYFYFEEKAADDADYQVRRMLERHGIRSFIEQMFPHAIYKPIATVYRKNQNQHHH